MEITIDALLIISDSYAKLPEFSNELRDTEPNIKKFVYCDKESFDLFKSKLTTLLSPIKKQLKTVYFFGDNKVFDSYENISEIINLINPKCTDDCIRTFQINDDNVITNNNSALDSKWTFTTPNYVITNNNSALDSKWTFTTPNYVITDSDTD